MDKNIFFNENGYLLIKNFIENPKELKVPIPKETGELIYYENDINLFKYNPIKNNSEFLVPKYLFRYNYPNYRELYFSCKKKIEDLLAIYLYPTYFSDKFYFAGNSVQKHANSFNCEITVSVQIDSNYDNYCWPLYFQDLNGNEVSILMNDGDAIIYKDCQIPHWRKELPSKYNKKENIIKTFRKFDDDTYHHQLFFHYVNANGHYLQYAFESNK